MATNITQAIDRENLKTACKKLKEDYNSQIDTLMQTGGVTQEILDNIKSELNTEIQSHYNEKLLDSTGVHGIRIIGDKLQYYDIDNDIWNDVDYIDSGNDGAPIGNVSRLRVKVSNEALEVCWYDPDVRMLENHLIAVWGGTKLVMKEDSYPENESDGTVLADNKLMNKYAHNGVKIDNLTNDKEYFFALFPYSDKGSVNRNIENRISAIPRKSTIFAFHIDDDESDPDARVTYPAGYTNSNYNPCYMDFTYDTFNWGDWENAFFMPKSCMVTYEGIVDYYLDENDEYHKADGSISDVNNPDYQGNAMMEWNKIYWKRVPDADPTAGYTFICSDAPQDKNGNYDPDMKCWSNYNCDGEEIENFYTPKFFGSNINSRLRSLAEQSNSVNTTAQKEVELARANNVHSKDEWYTEVYADYELIKNLLVLISKSTNSQNKFGNGITSGTPISTGTMCTKGMFYGKLSNSGVKVFGMENFFGNIWRRIAGLICDVNKVKVKLTYTTEDGSLINGYNFDGKDYIYVGDTITSNGSYISKMSHTNKADVATAVSGSDSTYYCDGYWTNGAVNYALLGGRFNYGAPVGMFCLDLGSEASGAYAGVGAALSCKPLI